MTTMPELDLLLWLYYMIIHHYCTIIIQLLHNNYTIIIQLSHNNYTFITQRRDEMEICCHIATRQRWREDGEAFCMVGAIKH